MRKRRRANPWPLDGGRDAAGANLVGAIAREVVPGDDRTDDRLQVPAFAAGGVHGARTLTRVLDSSPLDDGDGTRLLVVSKASRG